MQVSFGRHFDLDVPTFFILVYYSHLGVATFS